MTVPMPALVSIGLPVFNEVRHLDEALRALRAQDYPNLEIIVCDNASSDDTVAICRRHATEDGRIRIEVATRNQGATANFLRTMDLAKGEYFMWASGHDLWSPGLVSECVGLLERHPGASLAFGSADWIGPAGEPLPRETGWTDTRGLPPVSRFFTVFWGNMHPALGVMRIELLRAHPLASIVGADLVMLAAMSLRGDFLHATQARWSRRELRRESSYEQKVKRYASSDFGAATSRRSGAFPLLDLPIALVRTVLGAPIGALDKALALAALPALLLLRYRAGKQAVTDASRK